MAPERNTHSCKLCGNCHIRGGFNPTSHEKALPRGEKHPPSVLVIVSVVRHRGVQGRLSMVHPEGIAVSPGLQEVRTVMAMRER